MVSVTNEPHCILDSWYIAFSLIKYSYEYFRIDIWISRCYLELKNATVLVLRTISFRLVTKRTHTLKPRPTDATETRFAGKQPKILYMLYLWGLGFFLLHFERSKDQPCLLSALCPHLRHQQHEQWRQLALKHIYIAF